MLISLLAGGVIGATVGGLLGRTRSCEDGGCPLTANPWRGALYGGVLGLLAAFVFTGANKPDMAYASPIQKVVSAAQFDQDVLGNPRKTLVVFSASWCGACKAYKPELNKAAQQFEGRVHFWVADVDELPELAERYEVRSIPDTLIFENGALVGRFAGAVELPMIEKGLSS